MSTDRAIAPGDVVAGYLLEEVAGRGGMADVYRAYDPRLERRVALKLLSSRLSDDPSFRERMLRESRLAAGLDHPNVVPVYEAGEADDRLFIAMRYVDEDLRDVLRREQALAPRRAVAIAAQVASALDAAHERGLVHRDVKPSNVLLDGSEHVYLADFGLVQSPGESGPTDGMLLGTVDYAAPEQIRGDPVDARADVYALGCLLYECLTGEVPFAQKPSEVATIFAHLHEEPPPATSRRPSLPASIDPVLQRALAKDPGERPTSCSALVDEAVEALGLEREGRSRRRVVAAGLAALAAIAAAAAVAGWDATHGAAAAPTGHVVAIDPARDRVTASYAVSQHPVSVAVAAGRVWAGDFRDGSLWRLDPVTGEITRFTSNGEPRDIAALGSKLYVAADAATAFEGTVTRYDAVTGTREAGARILACAVGAGDGIVWAAGCPFVDRLSTGNGPLRVIRAALVPFAQPRSAENSRVAMRDVAVGEGALWVLGDPVDRRVFRIDPHSGRLLGTTTLRFAPRSIAVGQGAVWVTTPLDDVVVRLDPRDGHVTGTVRVPAGASGVATGEGSVWVTSSLAAVVSRIDPHTLRIESTTRVPGTPRELAVGAGKVWVTSDAS